MNAFVHEKRKRLTPLQRAELFAKADGHCEKCTRKIPHSDDWDVDEWDADHIKSLATGGTNKFPDNWQVLCSWCHGDKTADDNSRAAKSKRIYAQHVVPKRFTRSRSWGRR
jgi:5-methylcytosine-specific restriction endonuclease McrA